MWLKICVARERDMWQCWCNYKQLLLWVHVCVLVSLQIKRLEARLSKTDCTDSEGRERADGERWKEDSCTICECRVCSTYKSICSNVLVSPCFSLRAACPRLPSLNGPVSLWHSCLCFTSSSTSWHYRPPGTSVSTQCSCVPATSLPFVLYLWHFFNANCWQRCWRPHAKPGCLWSSLVFCYHLFNSVYFAHHIW